MNCNTTHYRANSSSVPGDPTADRASRYRTLEAPYEFHEGPLIRLCLQRLGPNRHRLVGGFHHLVCDGRSTLMLVEEWILRYAELAEGRVCEPRRARPFAEFASAQREAVLGAQGDRWRAYWSDTLDGLVDPSWPAFSGKQTDGEAAIESSGKRGALKTFMMEREWSARLDDFCALEGRQVFDVLISIWLLLLHRVRAQQDIVVGIPVDLRPRGTTDLLLGPYMNMIALRSSLSGGATAREWIHQTGSRVRSAFRNRKLPFLEVVRVLPQASRAGVRAGFTLLDPVPPPVERADCLWGIAPETLDGTSESGSLFDAHLLVRRSGDQYNCGIRYDQRRVSPELAVVLERGMATLLKSVLRDPQRQIASLDWTPESERRELLALGAGRATPRSCGSLHSRIEARARLTPDAIALKDDDAEWTYDDLEKHANAVANALVVEGVSSGARVGIALPRSALQVAALLGALKAGASFVPIDTDVPAERLAQTLSDAGLAALIAASDQHIEVPEGTKLLCPAMGEVHGTPPAQVRDGPIAYWIYTSGSTGIPKAAGNAHRAVLNRLDWGIAQFRLGPGERVLYKTPLTFDVSVSEIFPPLMTGATLIIAPPNEHRDLVQLLTRIEREAITELHFVPSVFVRILDLLEDGRKLPSLKRVLLTGETVTPSLVERAARLLDAELFNMYGPVEAAIEVTYHRCRSGLAKTVPIGRPIDNVRVYLLDAEGCLVPRGLAGEIYLGGECAASGYLHRPELTAERFVQDSFAGDPPGMMYRTGDFGCWNVQGDLEFLGRRDHQIKLNGVRIELGEIENALARNPAVTGAICMLQTAGRPMLVAYVTPEGVDGEALRAELQAKLPQAMIPSAIVSLARFPLNANGKVDRAALPTADFNRSRDGLPLAPGLEQLVAEVWTRTLGVPVRFADDNFFELGGDSLQALQALILLESEHGVSIDLAGFMAASTVRALAARLGLEGRRVALQLHASAAEAPFCVSVRQRRLVRSALRNPANFLDHLTIPLRLRGALNIDALQAAIRDALTVHNAPRAVFEEGAGGSVSARLLPIDQFGMDVTTLKDDGAIQDEAVRMAASMDRAGFELDLPLFRAVLLTSGSLFHALVLCVHHAVLDGWSIGPLTRSIAAAYEARRAERPPNLRAPAYQYWDYAAADAKFHQSEEASRRLAWWEAVLRGHPWRKKTILPARPFAGALHTRSLGDGLRSRLSHTVRIHGLTRQTVFLAAFVRTIAAVDGNNDVLVSAAQMNRERAGLDGVAGYFVNQVPLRFSVPPSPVSQRNDLERMRDALIQARANAVSCDFLVEHLWPDLYFERFLPARYSLNVIPDVLPQRGLMGIDASFAADWAAPPAFLYFDAMLFVNPDSLVCDLAFDRDIFGDSKATWLLDAFSDNLQQLTEGNS